MANGNPGNNPQQNPNTPPNTPDPKDLKMIEDYFKKVYQSASQISDKMRAVRESTAEFNKELEAAKLKLEQENMSLEDTLTTLKNIAAELDLARRIRANQNRDIFNQLNAEQIRKSVLKEITKESRYTQSIINDLVDDLQGIRDFDEKRLESLLEEESSRARILQHTINYGKTYGNLTGDELSNAEAQLKLSEKTIDAIKERIEKEKEYVKKLGLTGAAVQGISKIMSSLGMGDYFDLNSTIKKMRTAAKEGKGSFEIMGIAAKEVGKSLTKALEDPLFQITAIYKIFKSLVTSALNYQKAVFEASKNLGLNVKEAEKLVYNFNQMAAANSDLALTSAQMIATYQQLSDRLGVMTRQDEEFLTTSSAIMRNLGLSAEQMESIQLFATSNNKTVKETFASIIGTAKAQGARLKIAMTEKQIMDGIGKVSATVFNNFKGNVVELSKAVVQATKFGTTLDQINQAGMQFLDFESSISKEFEAQLLTGKQMDLTMARQYALTGETDKLMGEITRQLGSQNAWNNMNVIQQQSLAESLGMSKEAVDEMFKKQQLVSVLGEHASKSAAEQYEYLKGQGRSHADIVKLMGEEAVANAMQASAQDKMTAAMQNMSLAIGAIADAFLPITSVVSGIASLMGKITGSSKTLAKIMSAIMGYYIGIKIAQGVSYAISQRQLVLDAARKAGEIMSMRRATFKAIANAMSFGGPAGFIFAGLAAAALAYYASSLGVEGAGSSVGVSSAGDTSSSSDSISPMNQPAATAKASRAEYERHEGSPKVFVNITDNSRIDPITGNKLRDLTYQTNNNDSATGPIGRL